ncbi:MAG: beta-propeller fold lactonase family protein [Candidatus Taylorbacteria bacterium]|nr:beta-propeller fold lactonase family protein [Candidatus Taylorbacteria bacterium]
MNKFLVAILALVILFPFDRVHAAAYTATDVLGQVSSDGSANYTGSSANNGLSAPAISATSSVTGILYHSAVDEVNNRLFIVDGGNKRVLVFQLDSDGLPTDRTADYVIGQANFTASTYAVTQSGLSSPNSIAYDPNNSRLFVGDSNRVLVYDVATSTMTNGMNASYVLGQTTFTGSTGAVTQAGLSGIQALAYDSDSDRLFVGNSWRTTVFDVSTSTMSNGKNASNILGQSSYTSSTVISPPSNTSMLPYDLKYDTDSDRLFVLDGFGRRALVFNAGTSTISNNMAASYVVACQNFVTSCGGPIGQIRSSNPNWLAYDPTNKHLYVGDTYRVTVFDAATSTISSGVNALYVLGQPNYTTSGKNISSGGIEVRGLSIHAGGRKLYVSSYASPRVAIFDITTLTDNEAAVDVLGTYDENGDPTHLRSSYTTNSKGLYYPASVQVDTNNHRIFITEGSNNRVVVFNLNSNNQIVDRTADNVLGQPGFISDESGTASSTMEDPYGLVIDSSNRLYVADSGNYRINVYDASTLTDGEEASNVLLKSSLTTSSCSDIGQNQTCSYYNNLDIDNDHDQLFVSFADEGRVLVFDTSNLVNGMNASYVLGAPDFTSYGDCSDRNSLCEPYDVVYDSNHNRLFVVDASDNRVMVYDTSSISNGMNASYVLGQSTFTSTGYGITDSTLSYPVGAAYDSGNDLLFVSDGNNRVLVYDVQSITNGESAIGVLGQATFTTSSSGATAGALNDPHGLDFATSTNSLYVVDQRNHRMVVYSFLTIATSSLANATQYQDYSASIPAATGSQGNVTYEIYSGSLPAGMTLSGTSITGASTQSGVFNFTIRAKDTVGVSTFYSQPVQYTITVAERGKAGRGGGASLPAIVTAVASSSSTRVTTPVPVLYMPSQIVTLGSPEFLKMFIPLVSAQSMGLGSRSNSVQLLQKFLNNQGFVIAKSGPGSPGNETDYFGVLTQKALAAFQKKNNINPASGFFGPITRGVIWKMINQK